MMHALCNTQDKNKIEQTSMTKGHVGHCWSLLPPDTWRPPTAGPNHPPNGRLDVRMRIHFIAMDAGKPFSNSKVLELPSPFLTIFQVFHSTPERVFP